MAATTMPAIAPDGIPLCATFEATCDGEGDGDGVLSAAVTAGVGARVVFEVETNDEVDKGEVEEDGDKLVTVVVVVVAVDDTGIT